MTNTIAPLFVTYRRAYQLWTKSFIDLLPFLLLWMLSQILLEKYLPQKEQIEGLFFLTLFLDMAISALFFGIMLAGLYQRHQSLPFDFMTTLKKGASRFVPNFLAYTLVTLPLLLVLSSFALLLTFGKQFPVAWVMQILSLQHLIIVLAALSSLVLVVFFFVSGVCIVALQERLGAALRHSYLLTKKYWMDTLLLVLLFAIIAAFISIFLQEMAVPYAKAVVTLLLGSYYPALMIIHFENMVQAAIQAGETALVSQIVQKSHQV